MTVEQIINEFSENYLKVAKDKLDAVPVEKRGANPAFIKLAHKVEFLEKLDVALRRLRADNLAFLASAETVFNKMDKYRIGVNEVLLPIQIDQLQWIKRIMEEISKNEEYKHD